MTKNGNRAIGKLNFPITGIPWQDLPSRLVIKLINDTGRSHLSKENIADYAGYGSNNKLRERYLIAHGAKKLGVELVWVIG